MKKAILVSIFLMFCLSGFSQQREEMKHLANRLPKMAQIKNMLGNHWYHIEMKGQEFLYHYQGSQQSGYEVITKHNEGKFEVTPIKQVYVDANIYGKIISSMPLNAKIIEILGNGWFVIEFEPGVYYLYHKSGGAHGSESLCKLN